MFYGWLVGPIHETEPGMHKYMFDHFSQEPGNVVLGAAGIDLGTFVYTHYHRNRQPKENESELTGDHVTVRKVGETNLGFKVSGGAVFNVAR